LPLSLLLQWEKKKIEKNRKKTPLRTASSAAAATIRRGTDKRLVRERGTSRGIAECYSTETWRGRLHRLLTGTAQAQVQLQALMQAQVALLAQALGQALLPMKVQAQVPVPAPVPVQRLQHEHSQVQAQAHELAQVHRLQRSLQMLTSVLAQQQQQQP
jgi:hypothetical protein